jgi:hypothetical protein
MKHFRLLQVVPNILVTERAKPMLRKANASESETIYEPIEGTSGIIVDGDSGSFSELKI